MVNIRPLFAIPGNAEANVRERVARSVVQIQVQNPSVATIVPIATTMEGSRPTYRPNNHNYYTK